MSKKTYSNAPMPPITLESLAKIHDDFKPAFTLAGMKPIESRFVPEGIVVMASDRQLAIINTLKGSVVVVDKPTFPFMKPDADRR